MGNYAELKFRQTYPTPSHPRIQVVEGVKSISFSKGHFARVVYQFLKNYQGKLQLFSHMMGNCCKPTDFL